MKVLPLFVGVLILLILNIKDTTAQNASCLPINPGASKVSVQRSQLFVSKRNPDTSLTASVPFSIKGVCYAPASKTTNTTPTDPNNANVRRREFPIWYKTDLPLLKKMNVNTVRTLIDFGVSDTAKNILDQFYCNDIMVIMTVDDAINDTARIRRVVQAYKDHPAILCWMIGNEWNINRYYGVASSMADAAQRTQTAASLIKSLDSNHPVATSYGDIDINDDGRRLSDTRNYVNNVCTAVDIWGLNIYRGSNFGFLFSQWKGISNKPIFLSEYGTDAFRSNNVMPQPSGQVDEAMQAAWDIRLWQEIYRNLSAYDTSKIVIGGTVFEWNDEWWKASPHSTQNTGGYAGPHPDTMANEDYWGITDIDRKTRAVYDSFKTGFAPSYNAPPRAIPWKAESAGYNVPGTFQGFVKFYKESFLFYGLTTGFQGRGFNVAAVDTSTGELIYEVRNFDTWNSRNSGTDMNNMINFLNGLPNGTLILIAVRDEAGLNQELTPCAKLTYSWVSNCFSTLEALGSTMIRNYCYRNSWAMISIKGSGTALSEQSSASTVAVAQGSIYLPRTAYPPSLPLAPTIVVPMCNAIISTPTTSFYWGTITDAATYHLQVAKDSLFFNLLVDTTVMDTAVLLTNSVDSAHFWRVSSHNTTGSSRWSCTGKFSVVLPLNLLTFTVQRTSDRQVILQWQTAAESNTDYFSIERSSNGRDYKAIGKVPAAGNSSQNRNYRYVDENIEWSASTPHSLFYRLKMFDKDGLFTYSAVRSINFSNMFRVSIYPNPIRDILQVQIDNNRKTAYQVQVLSMDGRVVLTKKISAAEGSISSNINLNGLHNGNYLLKVITSANEEIVQRFAKQ